MEPSRSALRPQGLPPKVVKNAQSTLQKRQVFVPFSDFLRKIVFFFVALPVPFLSNPGVPFSVNLHVAKTDTILRYILFSSIYKKGFTLKIFSYLDSLETKIYSDAQARTAMRSAQFLGYGSGMW